MGSKPEATPPRKIERHLVAKVGEIAPRGRKLVTLGRKSVGIFNLDGEHIAVLNLCPHQLAPICAGTLRGTALPVDKREVIWGMEGRILVCPWHAWEFELPSGRCLTDARRLKTYPVIVENDGIYVEGSF